MSSERPRRANPVCQGRMWPLFACALVAWATGSVAEIVWAADPVLSPQKFLELPWGKGVGSMGYRSWTHMGNRFYDVPTDLDVDRDGNLYILDSANRRIVVLSRTGQWKGTIPISWDRKGPISVAVQPDGERILTRRDSHMLALCEHDRHGKLLGCSRLPPGFVYRTLNRSIGISSTGVEYVLAFHREPPQYDILFALRPPRFSPEGVVSTQGVAQPLTGPSITDFIVSEQRILVAWAHRVGDNHWHGKYLLFEGEQSATELIVPYAATGRLIGFIGNEVAALAGDLNMGGPAELQHVTLGDNGLATAVKYILPYPSPEIYSDLDGTKLVFRMVAPYRLLAMAATKGGLLLAQYDLPTTP